MAKTAKETKEKLIKDFRSVIADTEELMKFVSSEGGGKAQALRDKIDDNLKGAKEYLQNIEGAVVDKSRVAARVTDDGSGITGFREPECLSGIADGRAASAKGVQFMPMQCAGLSGCLPSKERGNR